MSGELQAPQAQPASSAGRPSRRRRWIAAALLAALVLALALGAWLRWRTQQPEPPLPDLTEADEEVAETIRGTRDQVLRHPTSAAWGRLGEVLMAHEFNAEANRCFQQAEHLDPREPAWSYLQGLNLINNDPPAAIACLERAVHHSADTLVAPRLQLAEVLLERNRFDEAQALLERVLAADPTNVRARLGLGRLALLRQEWRAGLEQLEACRDDGHARKRSAALRAETWDQLGEPARARAERSQAAALPDDRSWPDPYREQVLKQRRGLRARFQAVDDSLRDGQLETALQMLHETVERHPNSVEGWMRLGGVWLQVKRLDQAQACYRQAVRVQPDMAEAWIRLGTVQYAVHSRESADSFRQAIRLKPDHAEAHFNLGQCLNQQGDRDGAAAEFREALRCRPDYDRARAALRELEAPKGEAR
jgi:cytochrome c-type biogenesis protein CcmH/NrfG